MQHHFDVEIATKYGVHAAVILDNLQFWIEHNRANEKCYAEGRYWTYNSVKAFARLYPYMSEQAVRTALQKLIDGGLIIKGNFSKTQDRTTWYTITEKGEQLLGRKPAQEQQPEPENPFSDYGKAEIPDTVETYAARNLSRLSPGNMQEFAEYKQQCTDDVIKHAIDISCRNGAAVWAYTRKILDRYIDAGLVTLDAVLEDEEKKEKRQASSGQGSDDNPLLRTKFY